MRRKLPAAPSTVQLYVEVHLSFTFMRAFGVWTVQADRKRWTKTQRVKDGANGPMGGFKPGPLYRCGMPPRRCTIQDTVWKKFCPFFAKTARSLLGSCLSGFAVFRRNDVWDHIFTEQSVVLGGVWWSNFRLQFHT